MFVAQVVEWPGIMAHGDTREDAAGEIQLALEGALEIAPEPQCSFDSVNCSLSFLGTELTLPNPDHLPARIAQRAGDQSVARNIFFKLRQPEFSSGFRCVAKLATRMAMPKTAVDKNSNALLRKNKIGFAKQAKVPAPPIDPRNLEKSDQPQLSIAVAGAANTRHYIRSLYPAKDVGHIAKRTPHYTREHNARWQN